MSANIVVAVDIDEVLAQFVPALAEYHNEFHGESAPHLTANSFHSYSFHEVWGGTRSEADVKMLAFYESEHFKALKPVDGAREALQSLKQELGVDLQIVTARQLNLEAATREWIEFHFPGVFSALHFGNHYGTEGRKKSKPEMCKDINAVCLIDDNAIYCSQCALEKIPCVLFGSYAWNKVNPSGDSWTVEVESFVERADNWEAAKGHIKTFVQAAVATDTKNQHNNSQVSSIDSCFTMACIQMTSSNDKEHNLQTIERLTRQSVEEGMAKFVSLPEACCFMGANSDETKANAEYLYGPSVRRLQKLAADLNIFLAIGGFALKGNTGLATAPPTYEQGEDSVSKYYNTAILIDPQGAVVNTYAKMHLFDNPLTGMKESSFTLAGDKLVSASIEGGCRLGLSICYDVRFPALYHELSKPLEKGGLHGAEIIIVPSAFMVPTGEAHWEILLRARAIECQVYILAAAQVGAHNGGKRHSYGHSMIIDPFGNILGECDGEAESICYAQFDRTFLHKIRNRLPVHSHNVL